jgi:flagellar motor switch protein FliG
MQKKRKEAQDIKNYMTSDYWVAILKNIENRKKELQEEINNIILPF